MKSIVTISHLKKCFSNGNVCVANAISLSINEGEIFTVLGKSGSGKTTFLRMIAGLETPDDGEICIDNSVVFNAKTNVAPNKRGVAVVFQNYALLPHLTIASNITFGGDFSADELHDILEKTNLEDIHTKYPHEISGGQQQRVALARALIHRPKILLLDEPLSNIDTELRSLLRDELKTMIKAFGITALFITHDKEDAFFLSDRIAIMQGGDVLQIGTPKEIYYQPKNLYCANFLGKINHISQNLYARAEDIYLCEEGEYQARVHSSLFYGGYYEITLASAYGNIIMHHKDDLLKPNQTVHFAVKRAIYI